MLLYEVPRNSIVRIIGDAETPPASLEVKDGEVLHFYHIDGMYGKLKNSKGQQVYVKAWQEVIPCQELASLQELEETS